MAQIENPWKFEPTNDPADTQDQFVLTLRALDDLYAILSGVSIDSELAHQSMAYTHFMQNP